MSKNKAELRLPTEIFHLGDKNGEHTFKFTALPASSARALAVKLLKQCEDVLPLAKAEAMLGFTTPGRMKDEDRAILATLFAGVGAINQMISNLNTEKLESIIRDVFPNIRLEEEVSGGSPVYLEINPDEFFANRPAFQLLVLGEYLKWSYADFFDGALSAKFDALKDLWSEMTKRQEPQATESTTSTSESSQASDSEDNP